MQEEMLERHAQDDYHFLEDYIDCMMRGSTIAISC